MIYEEVNFSIEEELEIILVKRFDVESHIKGYPTYMNEWTPEIDEILKIQDLKMLLIDFQLKWKKKVK